MERNIIHHAANEIVDKLIKWRRDFHHNPETGLDCFHTSSIIADELKKLNYKVKSGFAKTGIVASVGEGKPVVAFRVDMDALPVKEETGLPFASSRDNVMHACGHDGHSAIGLGVANIMALLISKLSGKFVVIFQPGEEYPGGAPIMIEEGALAEDMPEMILGMHIFPDLPSGKIGLRYGVMTASNVDFSIHIEGQGAHGAYPHKSIDPFPAVASLINCLQTIVSRNVPPLEAQVISLGEINGGSGYNVVPNSITVKGTIRSLSEKNEKLALKRLNEIVSGIEKSFNVNIRLNIIPGVPMMICDENITSMAEKALINYWGRETVTRISQPSMGVDDFSNFTKIIPSTYMRLGSYDEEKGYIYPLHNSHFDFDEKLLRKGVEAAVVVLYQALVSLQQS